MSPVARYPLPATRYPQEFPVTLCRIANRRLLVAVFRYQFQALQPGSVRMEPLPGALAAAAVEVEAHRC